MATQPGFFTVTDPGGGGGRRLEDVFYYNLGTCLNIAHFRFSLYNNLAACIGHADYFDREHFDCYFHLLF